ncbi:MAG TPA: hypothetical protein VNT01_17330 [Symbiobacteriaceae bacterium]|nr:hypothetical protein [Symbiobacteriaceae bacterium]
MGCLVIHPTAPGYRPTPEALQQCIDLLVAEKILGAEIEPSTWTNGPDFGRLGVPMGSQPMTVSVRQVDTTHELDEVDEDWERTLAQQRFYLSIHDSAPQVDRTDPIWTQMEEALGTPLNWLYFHI